MIFARKMEVKVSDAQTMEALIRQLGTCKGLVVNIYYQVIGDIKNSTVCGVNIK